MHTFLPLSCTTAVSHSPRRIEYGSKCGLDCTMHIAAAPARCTACCSQPLFHHLLLPLPAHKHAPPILACQKHSAHLRHSTMPHLLTAVRAVSAALCQHEGL
eukprot:544895-Pelagomonas_calceolata.AAC.7